MNKYKVITCTVTQIDNSSIVLDFLGKKIICDEKQISDYKVDLFSFFSIGKKYKFTLSRNEEISYKKLRPKLIKNKKEPIPTISQHYNLEKNLLALLNKLEKTKNCHKVT